MSSAKSFPEASEYCNNVLIIAMLLPGGNQQGATPRVAKESPIIYKFMRKLLSLLIYYLSKHWEKNVYGLNCEFEVFLQTA